jgi:hypothetical protein
VVVDLGEPQVLEGHDACGRGRRRCRWFLADLFQEAAELVLIHGRTSV